MRSDITPRHPKVGDYSKHLRTYDTYAEKILWHYLRAKRFNGCKFRRQVPVGPYIVDFLCVGAKLVIELDGDHHWEPSIQDYDKERDAYLRSWGFRVVRFGNMRVIKRPKFVLRELEELLNPSP